MGRNLLDFTETIYQFFEANGIDMNELHSMEVKDTTLVVEVKEMGSFTRVYNITIEEDV